MEGQTIAIVGGGDTGILCHILARKNLRVVPVSSGGEALAQLESIRPALVLLDLPLPDTGAEAFCKTIRCNLHTRCVPVLVLSPTDEPGARVAAFQSGADDFLGKPFDPTELIVRVHTLLRRSVHANLLHPLSGLPSSILFRQEVESLFAGRKEGALMYCYLENLKALNDRYGFERGDRVLLLLAQILRETSVALGHTEDILGHIGGDDFVIFTACPHLGEYAQRITGEFDARVPAFYDEEDRRNKYIFARDPQGQEQHFPLLGVSIGIVRSRDVVTCNYARLLELAKEVRLVARGSPGSGYFINRRRAYPMSSEG